MQRLLFTGEWRGMWVRVGGESARADLSFDGVLDRAVKACPILEEPVHCRVQI